MKCPKIEDDEMWPYHTPRNNQRQVYETIQKKTGYPDQDLSPGVAGCCEKVTDLGVGGTSILNF
jgi:hypothetical protein